MSPAVGISRAHRWLAAPPEPEPSEPSEDTHSSPVGRATMQLRTELFPTIGRGDDEEEPAPLGMDSDLADQLTSLGQHLLP